MPSTGDNSPKPEDIFKILVATDIHLGYGEKNPIKAEDSFVTFEELLQIGVDAEVDMVLLGGDLFHENKPSRLAEKQCISILKKFTLGDKPVEIELLSDPAVNFSHCEEHDQTVNYMNPNMNIGLPVFSIHGNHDDPVGLGGLSALDNLHATGLINYFGRINNLKDITVTPLLFRKGATKLALYGLSSVKDERLHRLFREGKIHLLRPIEETESWFNLLVVHQNRVKHGATNYLPEHFIDGFFDLVVWGHEHECRLTPEHVVCGKNKEFHISQPGSSVATSLCDGEAKEKRVGILEVHKGRFKMTEKKLLTVRPMIFRSIYIEDEIDFRMSGMSDAKISLKIDEFLRCYVEKLLQEEVPKLLTGHPKQPTLPLVRVRVEYKDERHQLAVGRFGNHFQDKVANPSDILLFRKRVERAVKGEDVEVESELMEALMARHLASCTSMEDLIGQYFYQTEEKTQLQLIGIKSIGTAVKAFINKDDKDAVSVIVDSQIKKFSKALIDAEVNDEEVEEELNKIRMKRLADSKTGKEEQEAKEVLDDLNNRKAKKSGKDDINDIDDVDDDDDMMDDGWKSTSTVSTRGRGRARGATAARATGGGRGRGRGRGKVMSDNEDEDFGSTHRPTRSSPAKPAARANRGGGRGSRAKTPVVAQPSIASAFARQSQTQTGRSSKKAILYESSDSD